MLIHLLHQHLDRIVDAVVVRHALEHVLRGELPLLAVGVVRLFADEVVVLCLLLARCREADHRVDNPHLGPGLLERFNTHWGAFFSGSLNTRCAFSCRNLGHTWSRNGTAGISSKMRS